MEHELALAGDIQQNLLPSKAPLIEGWDIAGTNTPCYTIGGDYFDYIPKPSGRLAFALGDVSGKGAGAALMMMVLRATVHSACQQEEGDVLRFLSKKNDVWFPKLKPVPVMGTEKENHTSWERYYRVSDCSSSSRNNWYLGR